MKAKCPYCGGELKGELALPEISQRKQRIYRAVLAAGPGGINPKELLLHMYTDGQKPTRGGGEVLRVMIFEINKVLRPFELLIISRPRGSYRLIGIGRKKQYEQKDTGSHPGDHQNQG